MRRSSSRRSRRPSPPSTRRCTSTGYHIREDEVMIDNHIGRSKPARSHRVFGLIIVLAVAMTVLSGCGARNSIVGKWKSKAPASGQPTTAFAAFGMTKEFKADGTEVTAVALG